VKKTYVALTIGNPGKRVVIDKPIGRHPIHRQRMRVVPDPHKKDSSRMTPEDRRMLKSISAKSASQAGRRALSFVDTMAFDGKLSVVQVRIETGRTHQIRVHLQDRHTPIYGDEVYGLSDWNKQLKKSRGVERPLLHAHRLELVHPILTEQKMVFLAPMAKDMAETADTIWPQGREERPDLFYGHGKQQESNNPQQ
jgi:23S rRNA pseudouridine1911/1915/1917 synthase